MSNELELALENKRLREALDTCLAGIGDHLHSLSYKGGKGLSREYAQAVQDEIMQALKSSPSQSLGWLKEVKEALKSVNPWCSVSHGHNTCDWNKIKHALTILERLV